MPDPDHIQRQRDEMRRLHGDAYEKLAAILFDEDPIGINFEDNVDEYTPEVGTILPRLHHASSIEEIRRVVHEEFVRWFYPCDAGPAEKYQRIAERIWHELLRPLRDS